MRGLRQAIAVLALLAVSSAAADGQTLVAQGTSAVGRPRTCLVLSGGGARGAAHIGVLKVLESMQVPIDCVVGTSMGAIIGAAWVSGTSLDAIERTLSNAQWDVLLGDEPARPRRSWRSKELERDRIIGAELGVRGGSPLLPTGAVFGQQLDGFLQSLLGSPVTRASFDEFAVPFRAIATDIESGRMTVLDRGSLNAAVRASMSVPGLLAPQDINGRLFVDGGLTRNLGVDVARSLGAERIVAVNLGTPLAGREELASLVGVTGQMINILTEQNVNVSLAQLGPDDVLISPELGSFSAANFREATSVIAAGEEAAGRVREQLARLAVDPVAYRAWRASRLPARVPAVLAGRVSVSTRALRHVAPATVQHVFDDAIAAGDPAKSVDRAVAALYGMDDFEQVSAVTVNTPDGDEIVIEPREKSWGPNYLRFGLSLSTDLDGRSAFSVLGDLRVSWLNAQGLEWRTQASLGDVLAVKTELLQPVGARQRWFGSAYVDARRRLDDFFLDDDSIARYRNSVLSTGLEARRRFDSDAELRVGARHSWFDVRRSTGVIPLEVPNGDTNSVYLQATVDRLDNWDFPRSGVYGRFQLDQSWAALGGSTRYRKAELELQRGFGRDRHALSASLRFGTAFGSNLPLVDAFDVGGFHNLSGLGDRQIIARRVAFGRVVYAYQIGATSAAANGLYVGGSLELASIGERLNSGAAIGSRATRVDEVVGASSLFIAADTAFGPAYLGAGIGEGGERAFYLFLGRP